jgi:hypothetical protein
LPLGPAVFFCDARIESVKPFQYLPTPLHAHLRVPFVPFSCVALRSVFDLALVEESDGLLEKLFLATGIVAALEIFVLIVADPVLQHVRSPPTVDRPLATRDYTLVHA